MASCNLCGSRELLPLIDFGRHPVSKHYLSDPHDSPPTWPMQLAFCEACGLTQLVDACPPEVVYNEYVTLSAWKSQPQARRQIDFLRRMDGLTPDSAIIEIGCNDGGFLSELRVAGFTNLIGVERARDAVEAASRKGFTIVPDFLTAALADTIAAKYGQFDLLISRQNLEHMSDLQGVVTSIDVLLRPGGLVLIEIPNYGCNLDTTDYSLWEEHVNYFTVETAAHLLSLAGIEVIHHEVILFTGESLVLIGRKTGKGSRSLSYVADLRQRNIEYAAAWPQFRARFRDFLCEQKENGHRIGVYGAASRAFCLINFAGLAEFLEVIIDDQPAKQNYFMPGGSSRSYRARHSMSAASTCVC